MVLTAVGLTRVVGVADLGLVRGQDLDRVLGLVSVPAMVPITGRVLDRRAAQLPLLHPVIIRLNRSNPRLIFENISRRGPENCRSLHGKPPGKPGQPAHATSAPRLSPFSLL